MAEDKLFDKIYGCLLGGAIGDTLGRPLEQYADFRVIEKIHGRVTDFLDLSVIGTDDTEIGVLFCKTYGRVKGRISPQDVAETWLDEAVFDDLFVCMRSSFELLKKGIPARYSGVGNMVTGSALMAIAPVGLFNACNPEDAYVDALDLSYMYQRGTDAEAAAVYAACIAEAMRPTASVDSILGTALEFSSDEPMKVFDTTVKETFRGTIKKALDIASRYTDVFEVREELHEKCLQWHQLDPLEVLTLTLAIFKVANGDPYNAIVGGANIGRDADTISNLNGALSGALYGYSSLPKYYADTIEELSNNKFKKLTEMMYEVIHKYAGDIENQLDTYNERTLSEVII